jgi:hypothetical protein
MRMILNRWVSIDGGGKSRRQRERSAWDVVLKEALV